MFILLFPLAYPLIAKRIFHTTINWKEMVANIAIVTVAVIAVWQLGIYGKMSDVEIWNGQVTGKEMDRVSCSHSYQCNCTTDSKGNTSCSTCYEHFADYNWVVHSTAGRFTINRIDRQGKREPPRWSAVQKGQPVAREHSYDNYIKAVPESLFNKNKSTVAQFPDMIPDYPRVYDYHYANRIITVGVPLPEAKLWNLDLSMKLRKLGPEKQANVIVVLINTKNQTYIHALEEAWLGGKKNDVVAVIGTDGREVFWTGVISWTDNQLFKVQLRDDLGAIKTLDRVKVLNTIEQHVQQSFVRKPMKDFEYLKDEIDPPTWVIVLALLISILGSIGLSILFHHTDYFGDDRRRRWRR